MAKLTAIIIGSVTNARMETTNVEIVRIVAKQACFVWWDAVLTNQVNSWANIRGLNTNFNLNCKRWMTTNEFLTKTFKTLLALLQMTVNE